MNPSPHVWRTQCNRALRGSVTAASVFAGLALSIGSRYVTPAGILSAALLVLGLLLLTLGCGLLLWSGQQAVEVDTRARQIVIEHGNGFGMRTHRIRFDDIAAVTLGQWSHRLSTAPAYHVVVKRRTGKELALFTGFIGGRHDKAAMELRRQRLLQCLGRQG